ncbi:MAG: TIGR01777 family oxidoreductase [Acidobacteriota bacterium]
MRRIVIAGGSGAVGTVLARYFHRLGDSVTVLSRRPQATAWKTVWWDGASLGDWAGEVDGADVVINLAGRSVDCRYTIANRREIMNSRVASTRVVGRAIAAAARPPAVWLNASTATIYRHSLDRAMDEATGEIGGREGAPMSTWKFSIDVATAWEKAFFEAPAPGVRKVALRSAMTAIAGVSWLGKLSGLAKLGLGGAAGAGTQYMSWIHETDFIRAVEFLIAHAELSGVVNVCSPHPVPNAEFMRALREACGVSFGPRVPEWMLRIGSVMIGTEAELILKSRRVVPGRLLAAGFQFRFPTWAEAVRELLWRPSRVAVSSGLRAAQR